MALGDDVLEIGPGPGRTTDVLREMAPRLTAVEIDVELAEALRARMAATAVAGRSVEVVQGDATALPFPDGRFSTALSFTMLHHVPSIAEQDRLFAEVRRVLRPGGTFVGVDSKDSDEFRGMHVDDICVPLDPGTLEERLRSAGFAEARLEPNEYVIQFRAVA
jgi:SAM-dependent methyltransferase